MRWFYRLMHLFYLGRAISRGPRYLARYELRRQIRRAAYRSPRWSRWL